MNMDEAIIEELRRGTSVRTLAILTGLTQEEIEKRQKRLFFDEKKEWHLRFDITTLSSMKIVIEAHSYEEAQELAEQLYESNHREIYDEWSTLYIETISDIKAQPETKQ